MKNSYLFGICTMGLLIYPSLSNAQASGIINPEDGTIEEVNGEYSRMTKEAVMNSGSIKKVDIDFVGNANQAIFNDGGMIEEIDGNYTDNIEDSDGGGVIRNQRNGYIKKVNGNFENNTNTVNDIFRGEGGVIFNNMNSYIDSISGEYKNNLVISRDRAEGGAISNTEGSHIEEIVDGLFEGNMAKASEHASGGAIGVRDGSGVGFISGVFNNNEARGGDLADGGAYSHEIFTNYGYVQPTGSSGNSLTQGIAHYYESPLITADFSNNKATATNKDGIAHGGAIYYNVHEDYGADVGTEGQASVLAEAIRNPGMIKIVNSNFYNNSAVAENGRATGGAVFGNRVIIAADGQDSVFDGNYTLDSNGKTNNAIYIDTTNYAPSSPSGEAPKAVETNLGTTTTALVATENNFLVLTAGNKGNVIVNDDIDGQDYGMFVYTDNSGEIRLNGRVDNARYLGVVEGSTLRMGKNADINADMFGVLDFADESKETNLKVDISVDAKNKITKSGVINVNDDVVGNTSVIVNAENPDVYENANTLFLKAENDDLSTASDFKVSRVIGSPYMWDAVNNYGGETKGSNWYLALSNEKNKEFEYAPEIGAYVGMPTTVVEQNKNIVSSIENATNFQRNVVCGRGGCKKVLPHKGVWVDATYETAEIDEPSEMDAEIKGVTAGVDLFNDGKKKFGAFASYRDGKYELSGKGDYYSSIGSEINTESYLGGLYYRQNINTVNLLATLFAGKQDIDVKTDDRVAYASTDAMQYGASFDVAKKYEISKYLSIEPSLGLYYTMVDVDEFEDNVGKKADFDVLHYLEAELGVKFGYYFCKHSCSDNIYFKPSIIRIFGSGGDVEISGLRHIAKGYKNKTLFRGEIGGNFGITRRLSGFYGTGYTFGDDYKSFDVNAGINYMF